MTDEVAVNASVEPVATVEPIVSAEAEKVVPQSTVNKVVAKEKKESYEKGYQDAIAKLKQEEPVATQAIESDAIEKKVAEALERKEAENARLSEEKAIASQWHALQANLAPKIASAKSAYTDFDEVIQDSDLTKNPAIFVVADQVDNSGDIIYELAKSPAKTASLTALLQTGSINSAVKYVKELSQSIKTAKAAKSKTIPAPLDNLTPSQNVAADSGKMELKDYKRKYRA